MYIWVEKRLGMLVGVTQRVNGIRPSVSMVPPWLVTQSWKFNSLLWMDFLAFSRSASFVSMRLPLFVRASRIPLSSKHSRIAPMRYAGPSLCRSGCEASGMLPSCLGERFPPGNTCAEANAEDVRTRWSSRISLLGEMRRMLYIV